MGYNGKPTCKPGPVPPPPPPFKGERSEPKQVPAKREQTLTDWLMTVLLLLPWGLK